MRVLGTRKVDALGRVVLPIELRKEFEIEENSDIDIYVADNQIILKKSETNCNM